MSEWTPEGLVRAEIEMNAWYPVVCEKCQAVTLGDDGADRIHPSVRTEGMKLAKVIDGKMEIFCARCGHRNMTPIKNRVLLKIKSFPKDFELNPLTESVVENMEI